MRTKINRTIKTIVALSVFGIIYGINSTVSTAADNNHSSISNNAKAIYSSKFIPKEQRYQNFAKNLHTNISNTQSIPSNNDLNLGYQFSPKWKRYKEFAKSIQSNSINHSKSFTHANHTNKYRTISRHSGKIHNAKPHISLK